MGTRFGILGDVHANGSWAMYALNKFYREGITEILQVGDFGFYGGQHGQLFLKRVNTKLKMYGQTLLIAPGNHEDYDYLETIPVSDDGWQYVRSNIKVAPRGLRWEKDGRNFLFLGGAPSVDRWYRTTMVKAKAWWSQEALTPEDVENVIAGGRADVMVCHDAPNGVREIDRNIAGNPMGFTVEDLAYAAEGRALMSKAFHAVEPKLFLHGHYHFPVDETVYEPVAPFLRGIKFQTHVLGLDCDTHNFSLGELNTDTLDASLWDIQKDYGEYLNR